MNKTAKWLLAALLLAAAASAAFLLLAPGQKDDPVARITLDGELVKEVDLRQVESPYTFILEGKAGLTNTIRVETGKIRVEAASCPDQVCVHQGFISNGTVPIVCLPNQLIIEITGGGTSLDAATG